MIASLILAVLLAIVVWLICASAGLPFIVALVLTLAAALVGWLLGPRLWRGLDSPRS